MSSEFDLEVIGALLELIGAHFWIVTTSFLLTLAVGSVCCMLFCTLRQRLSLVNPAVSMRLRSKRTCSGVECFGGFHIQKFSHLFLFLRGDFT
ncbi:uncharacterized protein LOC133286140 [Gastrolobium bilobum]|uniref:uncharacterized protein LOC133286140 n=1 Tax=Gastrolobium bilobum TaxID=150636 RepID=UPI002AB10C72|nr:uncharacterized protein LOC133286140 [Gastrolobium bilobum]